MQDSSGFKENKLEVAEPKVVEVDYSGEICHVDGSNLVAKCGNHLIMIRRRRGSFRCSVYEDTGGGVRSVAAADVSDQSSVDNLALGGELKDRIKYFIANWDFILERQVAEAYLRSRIKYVPLQITEREAIAEAIATTVLRSVLVKNFIVREGGREVVLGLHCYENGYYRECEEELKDRIESYAKGFKLQEGKISKWVVSEALGKIERRSYEDYRPEKHTLVFKDKLFRWTEFLESKDFEKSLEEPSPDVIVEHRVPWRINLEMWGRVRVGLEKYIPPKDWRDVVEIFKKVAPKSYAAFLSWVKREDESEEEALPKVALLLEVIGYTLYPHGYPLHNAILLVGSGSNGKSTYLRLVRTILGGENVASVNLRDLDPRFNRFAVSELFRKLANISAEPIRTRNFDATLFKQLTGEDLVRFERKFREAIVGENYAKMIFSANELPQIAEDTHAFWRRWIVIEFPNQFQEDPTFFERVFTQEEVEGTILCALHAFRLVLERRSFTKVGVKDAKEEWLRRSSPVYLVFRRMEEEGLVEFNRDLWVEQQDMYSLYAAYCRKLSEEGEDIEVKPKKTVTEELEKLFGVRRAQVWHGGRKYNAYRGVGIKDRGRVEEMVGTLRTPETSSPTITLYHNQ